MRKRRGNLIIGSVGEISAKTPHRGTDIFTTQRWYVMNTTGIEFTSGRPIELATGGAGPGKPAEFVT
ncbi:hypothetical protein [Sporotomaculum syntrophicum]|uniref:hypothetical protein n=1 Tax=Sporotomaculum syntrophicum TaxID=182264 RepID=UPI001379573B|nr:hypothetical protein [Sporotomaculum syntrophicum]